MTRLHALAADHPLPGDVAELLVHLLSDHGTQAAQAAADRPVAALLVELHTRLHESGDPDHQHPA